MHARNHPLRRGIWHSATVLIIAAAATALPAQTPSLVNLSTVVVLTAGATISSGFVISGGSKTLLIRADGPSLANFGLTGMPGPMLTLYGPQSAVLAASTSWSPSDTAIFNEVGAFALNPGSADADLVITLAPGSYTAQISGQGPADTGSAMLEIYQVSGSGQFVNLSSRLAVGGGSGNASAGFVIGAGSGMRQVLIRGMGPGLIPFGVPGILADPALKVYDGSGHLIASEAADAGGTVPVAAAAEAGAFAASAGDSAVVLTLGPGNYSGEVGSQSGGSGQGMVEIYDITGASGLPANYGALPRLYYANLQAVAGVSGIPGNGYATVLFNPDSGEAAVSLSFSNLSSPETGAHLTLGLPGATPADVFDLPVGQISGQSWSLGAAGPYSSQQIIAALEAGQISVVVDTADNPSGEISGGLALANGSSSFTPPSAPPALASSALTSPTQVDASRFLMQASFGPTVADIQIVVSEGIPQWITNQMAIPASSLTAGLQADIANFPNPSGLESLEWPQNTYAAWWKIAAVGPDQLRQRVAFALSEIFVVGNMTNLEEEGKTTLYDILANDAFGNFRQLLEDITWNSAMGAWLSYVNNQKANPATGTSPDENYARELQQLFTIGLLQLQPDGSLMLDASGQPIPTYNQTTITETAKILTGWQYAGLPFGQAAPFLLPDAAPSNGGHTAWLQPLEYAADNPYHDETSKFIVSPQQVPLASASPTVVPAGQTGPQDLDLLLDTLFNHPNTGPFICRELIQRLVTSNPSPGYIYRVARVFANDGMGVRGNLGAVVNAILTDYEARSPAVAANPNYGKIKEPLLRMTAFIRATHGAAPNGRYLDSWFGDPRTGGTGYPISFLAYPVDQFEEAPLSAATVFNFFTPNYSPVGPVSAAGLVAPEMEIVDESSVVRDPNGIGDMMYRPASAGQNLPAGQPTPSPYLVFDYSDFSALAGSPSAMLAELNLVLCANSLSPNHQSLVLNALQQLAPTQTAAQQAQTAFYLTILSAEFAVQK